MREYENIPKESFEVLARFVKNTTTELLSKGFSFDSVEVYFMKAIQVGLYEAEIENVLE